MRDRAGRARARAHRRSVRSFPRSGAHGSVRLRLEANAPPQDASGAKEPPCEPRDPQVPASHAFGARVAQAPLGALVERGRFVAGSTALAQPATVTFALPSTPAASQSGNLFGSIIVVTGPEQGTIGTFALALKETVLPFHSMCGLSFMPNGKCIPNCGFFLAKSWMHSYSAFVPAPARTSIAHPKKWRDGLDREQGPFSPAHTQLCSSLVRCADVTVTEPCVSTKARRNTALASINGRLRRSIFFSS